MKVNVGTGPDNWGVWFPSDPKQIPWDRYLDEVVEAGYEWTELGPYGYLPSDVDVLGQELEKRGLKLEAGFTFNDFADPEKWSDMEAETVGACRLSSALGAQHHMLIDLPYTDLFSGEPQHPSRLGGENWKRFIDTINRLSTIVRGFGLTPVVHPHAQTHVEYEDQIEQLLEDTDPNLVGVCLDTGHHAYCGGEPVAFMRKHYKRIPYLHIKSVDSDMQKKIEAENIPFAEAVKMGMFCEPSRGAVDFPAFVKVLHDVDYNGFGIVEQDMYPCPFDQPLPIAKQTRQYLREVGLG